MVGPAQDLTVHDLEGPRWEAALDLLRGGEGTINLRGLAIYRDPATAKSPALLHVEFDCPFDPSQVGRSDHDRLQPVAQRSLDEAREALASLCDADDRLAALVAESGVGFEFVHRYGMGALLVATAGRAGELSWR